MAKELKPKELSVLYDRLYDIADKQIKRHNPCNIHTKNGVDSGAEKFKGSIGLSLVYACSMVHIDSLTVRDFCADEATLRHS